MAFEGVWVESSLRLDTLDFDYGNRVDWSGQGNVLSFKTNIYTDTVINPNFPVSHSALYQYFFTNNKTKLNLRNFYSSSTGYGEYTFTLSPDLKKFTVDKFYNRRALPVVIEFVRIR